MASVKPIVMTAVLSLLASRAAPAQSVPPEYSTDKAEALSEAARRGDAAMVKKLLDQGVDVNTKYRYDVTALFYACDHGHLEVVKVLLDHGADVNLKDTFYHATPLSWATNSAMGQKPQHAEIVGLLLKHGAQGKESALRSAVVAPDAAMTKVVLEQGGLSPDTLSGALELAKKDAHQDIVTLLEQAGAKPYEEFKMDEAQLARYVGTYRDPAGTEVVLAMRNGRLSGSTAGQQRTLIARDETRFRLVEAPGASVTFHLDQGKAIAFDLVQGGQSGNVTTYTRVEGK